MEGHCIHFPAFEPGSVACSVCLHGPTEARPPKPDDWYIEAGSAAMVDPGDALLEGLLDGSTCPSCMSSRTGIGCTCSRVRIGQRDLDASVGFLLDTVERSDLSLREAGGLAQSVTKRVIRRIEVTPDEANEIRQDVRSTFEVEPKWFAPRVTEPTPLPV